MNSARTFSFNILLASLVVTTGGWLAWGGFPMVGTLILFITIAGFLFWRGTTIAMVWAWATLLLGVESFLWPVLTMLQVRSVTQQPSDEEMGAILSAVLMGVFASVFWIVFSYGLFKRAGSKVTSSPHIPSKASADAQSDRLHKKQ